MNGISIIIPTYNMQKALMRCMDAVAMQTHQADRIIVVDDGSTDATEDIMRAYPRAHEGFPLTFIRQEHRGASAARNRGFVESDSDYVMFLDADVALKKRALARLYEALCHCEERNDEAISRGSPRTDSIGTRDDTKETAGYAYSAFKWGWKKFSSFPFDAERLKQTPYIHTTSLIKRAILPENPFDEQLKRLQDWDLYLTLLAKGYRGVYLPEALFSVETKGTMSTWLPSIMYQIPFNKMGIRIHSLEKYRDAERLIRAKHQL